MLISLKLKNKNLENKQFSEKIDRDNFIAWFKENGAGVSYVFHIGARTDTTEFDSTIFDKLNINYSKDLWTICRDFI